MEKLQFTLDGKTRSHTFFFGTKGDENGFSIKDDNGKNLDCIFNKRSGIVIFYYPDTDIVHSLSTGTIIANK